MSWLAAELEGIGEPVDLVGHDWGAMFTMRLACQRPDLLRSWCVDIAGSFADDFVWHEASRAWLTPGEGEEAVAVWLAMGVPGRARLFESLGITSHVAKELAEAFDETMGRCILGVFRSAGQPVLAQWSQQLPAASVRPGLVVFCTEDIWSGGEARHRWVARKREHISPCSKDSAIGGWSRTLPPARTCCNSSGPVCSDFATGFKASGSGFVPNC